MAMATDYINHNLSKLKSHRSLFAVHHHCLLDGRASPSCRAAALSRPWCRRPRILPLQSSRSCSRCRPLCFVQVVATRLLPSPRRPCWCPRPRRPTLPVLRPPPPPSSPHPPQQPPRRPHPHFDQRWPVCKLSPSSRSLSLYLSPTLSLPPSLPHSGLSRHKLH